MPHRKARPTRRAWSTSSNPPYRAWKPNRPAQSNTTRSLPRMKQLRPTDSKPVSFEPQLRPAGGGDPDDGADQQHAEEDQAGDAAALAEGGVADHHCGDREEEAYDHAH